MTTEQVWLGATCAAATALALVALLLALRARRRAERAETLAASLAERLVVLESPAAAAPPVVDHSDSAFVITRMDSAPVPTAPLAQEIDGRLFADIVARESVIKAASWTHGLRRALSAHNRNRIRFEVRQETRRAGRDRRAETKEALRQYRARSRAAVERRVEVREDVA